MNFTNIFPTPTVFEFVDHSKIKIEWILEDVAVALDSWEYLVDFMVLHMKTYS